MAHQGGVLSIDWKGSTGELNVEGPLNQNEERQSSTTPTDPWGWLATAGMDGTVKASLQAHNYRDQADGEVLSSDMGHVGTSACSESGSHSKCQ